MTVIIRSSEKLCALLKQVAVVIVVAARAVPGSNRAAGKSVCFFHENHCDRQLWARAAQ